ncbi:MAG: DUF3426 domain-containing protein [Luteimonas sp.]|nr:DUF3426 domain-containing protein [Luteimonas sp.]
MFINCPYCNALVATDPASDLPPERCPRCAAALRTVNAEVVREVTATPAIAPEPAALPPVDAVSAVEPATNDTAGFAQDVFAVVSPTEDEAASAAAADARAIDVDDVSEAMLGPAAIEIEIERAGAASDDARDAQSMPEPIPEPEPEPITGVEPAPQPDLAAESLHETRKTPLSSEAPEEIVAEEVTPLPAVAVARTEARVARSAPSFVRAPGARASRPVRGWRAPLAIAGLALLLVLQLLLADRAQLAANARWRPWITSLCGVLHCTVPPWREAGAFTLLGRDVRPHPTIPGALRVTASFRNDARWPQPWPRLALTLSDVEGREAGARSFSAAEYLGATPTQAGLNSGQTATIAMDVIEPAPRIVAFTFEFH